LGEAIEGLEEKGRVERTVKNIKGFTSQVGLLPKLEKKGIRNKKLRDFSERTFKNREAFWDSSEEIILEDLEDSYDKALRVSSWGLKTTEKGGESK